MMPLAVASCTQLAQWHAAAFHMHVPNLSNVTLDLDYTWQWGHGLQVDSHYLYVRILFRSVMASLLVLKFDHAGSNAHLSFWLSTWLQEPGAAQRSTTLVTLSKMLNSSSSWSSLKALLARYPCHEDGCLLGIMRLQWVAVPLPWLAGNKYHACLSIHGP